MTFQHLLAPIGSSIHSAHRSLPPPGHIDPMIRLPPHRRIGLQCCLLFAVGLAACSAPVKVERVDLQTAYEDLNRTALSGDQLSETTRTVLRRAALLDLFDSQPETAIATLRTQTISTGMHWPDLYALSEMSYAEGRRTRSKSLLLASALYAYAVLFPTGNADRPSPYAAQFLHMTHFYNLALTQVLSGEDAKGNVTLEGGRFALPFGTVDVIIDQASLRFAGRTADLVRADDEPDGEGLQKRLPQRRHWRAARRWPRPGAAAGPRIGAAAQPTGADLRRAADGQPTPSAHWLHDDSAPGALHDL